MGFTQITSTNLSTDLSTQIAAGTAANNAVANIVSLTVKTCQVADSSYNALDDTAANTTGGYLVLTGTGFTPNCIVIVGQTNATSTSYVNTSCIRAQTQSFSAATYNIYVVDSYTGATAIKVNGYTTSSFPAWGTGASLSNQASNTAFGVSLSANSDSSITYANTTALPAGTSLLANGYFYGTVSIGTQTTYSFTVDAKDAENQDALRTFSMTVTVNPPSGLYAFGENAGGQLGTNDTSGLKRSSPVQVGSLATWSSVASGGTFSGAQATAAIKTDGTLWVWGSNGYGQLAQNDSVYRSSPVQLGALTNWSKVTVGFRHMAAIKTDGTLWVWGYGAQGALGTTSSISRSSPVQVGTDTNWSLISGGYYNTAAIRTNGTLWTWGDPMSGQLGLNDRVTYRSSPTQVGAGTTWSNVSIRHRVLAATKTDGTLWICGMNNQGQLGKNDAVNRSSPVQVDAGTTWSKISVGISTPHILATKTDGTLWAWGNNVSGQLGLGDGVARSSPTQIGALTNWSLISAGQYHSMAIKTDLTLWGWGSGYRGQLGQNNNNYINSPVQIGGATSWSNVSAGAFASFAIIT